MNRLAALTLAFLLSAGALAAQVPASQPAVTSADTPEVQQFQKLEDKWSEAVNERDQYGLELVLSPLFVDIAANGDISTRNQQLAQLITLEDKSLRLEQKVITVRMLGDIAVANGTYQLHHKSTSAPIDEKGVFTHVYQRTRAGWMCINSQRTVLREDTTGKAKKQSNADMPFHFPLFGHSDKEK